MTPADRPLPREEAARPSTPSSPNRWSPAQITRFLYTQNPFYLLSVAFVLHGTRLWYKEGAGPFDPWPLMAVISGYILLVAFTGFVLVRFGKVWDDARSIFLILWMLFVELSLTFDGTLISQPDTGRLLLLVGLGLSILVSEGLLLGLRIHLPPLFRVPYHLLLALLFLYPLLVVSATRGHGGDAVWRIFLFSPTAAIVLLTLLPAVRRGANFVHNNGTPWRWPWFPWTMFVFLTFCVGMRAYALSLSFDPVLTQDFDEAMRLESAFGVYFLVPLALAIGVLLLEAGLVAANRRAQHIALVLPILSILLSIPNAAPSDPYADFLDKFTAQLGSPLWLTVMASAAFFTYAWLRRIRHAEELLMAVLLIGSVVGRQTLGFRTLVAPQAGPLLLLATVQAFIGLRRWDSRRSLIAALCGIVAFRTVLPSDLHWIYRDAVPLHLAGLAVLTLGALFHDPFARSLRKIGVPLLVCATLTVALVPLDFPSEFPPGIQTIYIVTTTTLTFTIAYAKHSPYYFFAGIANTAIATARMFYDLATFLKRILDWDGVGFFLAGLLWFALAVLLSATKAGLTRRLASVVPRRSDRPPEKFG